MPLRHVIDQLVAEYPDAAAEIMSEDAATGPPSVDNDTVVINRPC